MSFSSIARWRIWVNLMTIRSLRIGLILLMAYLAWYMASRERTLEGFLGKALIMAFLAWVLLKGIGGVQRRMDRLARRNITRLILGRDIRILKLTTWEKPFIELLGCVVDYILHARSPSVSLTNALNNALMMVEAGRSVLLSRWSGDDDPCPSTFTGVLEGLEDKELLELIMLGILLMSALFRLWIVVHPGTQPKPFTRRRISRLRRDWFNFCLSMPTGKRFPPSPMGVWKGDPHPMLGPRNLRLVEWLARSVLLGEREYIEGMVRGLLEGELTTGRDS